MDEIPAEIQMVQFIIWCQQKMSSMNRLLPF